MLAALALIFAVWLARWVAGSSRYDERGRIMVLMTHNTDVADSWEREGEDPGFFYQFSPDAYAVGINVVLYALTH